MFKTKATKRTPDSVGVEQYKFDFQKEKNIYSYLYGIHMRKRVEKELEEKLKFQHYSEWKEYIRDKYSDYDSKKLMDFSRYLEQRIRRGNPEREYWKICVPIIITVIITNLPQMLQNLLEFDFSGAPIWGIILCVFIVGVLCILLAYVIYNTVLPLWESNTKENFLIDYKEIIDGMILEKRNQEKKADKKNKKIAEKMNKKMAKQKKK